jgi:hypothetical protein
LPSDEALFDNELMIRFTLDWLMIWILGLCLEIMHKIKFINE